MRRTRGGLRVGLARMGLAAPDGASIANLKVGFGRKPALYPAGAESRLFDMALKLSKMV